MAAVFALVMMMSMTMSAFAAEEVVDQDSVPSAERYVITPIDDTLLAEVPPTDADAIKAVTEGTSTADFANAIKADGADAVAAALQGKDWLTPFFDLHPEVPEEQGGAPETGIIEPIHVHVPGISSYAKGDISIIHFSIHDQKWEVLSFDFVAGEQDVIAINYKDLSPTGIAIVANKESKTDGSGSGSSSSSSSSTKKSSSPKTGVETGWEMFALAGVALALCGASFSRKKRA
jgi:LPXTG-motif cell wall-anchored protein